VTEASTIDFATRRLQAALDALDSAVGRRLERAQGEAALASQVHAFDADRARLASELDAAAARARGLETANREVAQRLDAAIATIRAVVEAPDVVTPESGA
jgi:L-lactate utilization protein LutB